MMDESKENFKWTRRLVYGTWGLVVVGITSLLFTCNFMSNQVDIAKESLKSSNYHMSEQVDIAEESLNRTWRPYLEVTQKNPKYIIGGKYVDTSKLNSEILIDTLELRLDTVLIKSSTYKGISYLALNTYHDLEYKNIGKFPLRITGMLTYVMLEDEWVNKYSKSHEMFAKDIPTFEEWYEPEIDLIINVNSIRIDDSTYQYKTILKEIFEESIGENKRIVIYPYTYVEYEDLFGRKYNTLLIKFMILEYSDDTGYYIIKNTANSITEKYRWDVGL